MARSYKNQPRPLLAQRRLAAPFLTVRQEARLRADREVDSEPSTVVSHEFKMPRIMTTPARPGFFHPASARDLHAVLRRLGPVAAYGLRVIALRQRPAGATDVASALRFGSFEVPGRLILFEQPRAPWQLSGKLASSHAQRLSNHGAAIVYDPTLDRTRIDWAAGSLRRFMLGKVFLHELGHHQLQHHKGKRAARVARRRDHESHAEQVAQRWRPLLHHLLDQE